MTKKKTAKVFGIGDHVRVLPAHEDDREVGFGIVVKKGHDDGWLIQLDKSAAGYLTWSDPAHTELLYSAAGAEVEAPAASEATPTQAAIVAVCDGLKELLLEKNRAYGNSALDPVRIFSKASAEEQLLVRIDDKLSRLVRGHEYPGDDTIKDLAGYLVLLLVGRSKP
jgi:hypothetical protein